MRLFSRRRVDVSKLEATMSHTGSFNISFKSAGTIGSPSVAPRQSNASTGRLRHMIHEQSWKILTFLNCRLTKSERTGIRTFSVTIEHEVSPHNVALIVTGADNVSEQIMLSSITNDDQEHSSAAWGSSLWSFISETSASIHRADMMKLSGPLSYTNIILHIGKIHSLEALPSPTADLGINMRTTEFWKSKVKTHILWKKEFRLG